MEEQDPRKVVQKSSTLSLEKKLIGRFSNVNQLYFQLISTHKREMQIQFQCYKKRKIGVFLSFISYVNLFCYLITYKPTLEILFYETECLYMWNFKAHSKILENQMRKQLRKVASKIFPFLQLFQGIYPFSQRWTQRLYFLSRTSSFKESVSSTFKLN